MAEQMKPSGIDWIGDIPENWKVKPLKYLAKCNQDVLLETTAPDYSFRYVDIGSVTYERGITEYQEFRFEDSPSRARRRVSVGDTIISTVRTYLKAIAIISDSENVIVSTGFAVYTPDKAIYPQYLYYFCKSEGFVQEIDKNSYGIAYPAINTELLSRIYIAYPCYEEQQAIADFLDKECAQIDSIAADLEKQIELLQQYKKSLITETVTKGLDKSVPMKDSGVEWIGKIPEHWELKHLKYLAKSILDGTHLTPTYMDDGIPFLRVTDITSADGIDAEINLDSVARISKEEHRILCQRCHPQKGDVLVSKNGTIGVPKIIDWDWEFSIFVSLCLIKLNDSLLNKWLFYYFKSTLIATEIAFAGKTNTITNLHLEKIANFKIPLPSVEEQKLIATYLDEKVCKIDALIKEKQNQLETLLQHKKSLIYEYVTGKKRVKEVR